MLKDEAFEKLSMTHVSNMEKSLWALWWTAKVIDVCWKSCRRAGFLMSQIPTTAPSFLYQPRFREAEVDQGLAQCT